MIGCSPKGRRVGDSVLPGSFHFILICLLIVVMVVLPPCAAENNTTALTGSTNGTTAVITPLTTVSATQTMISMKKPVIEFSANPLSGAAPLTVTFFPVFNSSGGAPDFLLWDFGDGSQMNRSLTTSYEHTYLIAGTYTVSLVSTNAAGSSVFERQAYITVHIPSTTVLTTVPATTTAPQTAAATTVTTAVPAATPTLNLSLGVPTNATQQDSYSPCRYANQTIAQFNAVPSEGPAPLRVSFTDNSTCAPPVDWLWDFGTVTNPGIKTMRDPVVTYTEPGNYTVTLVVKNRLNGNSTVTKKNVIRVLSPVTKTPYPTATPTQVTRQVTPDFVANVTAGDAPLNVRFTDSSSGAVVTSWLWDFGDGTNASESNPVHIYRNAGNYTVVLKVTAGGAPYTKVRENYIQVRTPAAAIPLPIILIIVVVVVIGILSVVILRGKRSKGSSGSGTAESPKHQGRRGGRDL